MRVKYILLCLCSICTIAAAGQTDSARNPTVFTYVEKMPAPGYDIYKYLSENVVYPINCRRNNIEGRVVVKFVVNEDGHISNAVTFKSSGSTELDNEAVRVVSTFPSWKPGTQEGKIVSVYFSLPIVFTLGKNDDATSGGK